MKVIDDALLQRFRAEPRCEWCGCRAPREGLDPHHIFYKASGYEINPCRFFDSNEAAMADMKRLAEAEAAKP